MFRHNGFDKELIEGTKNAFRMRNDVIRPKFRFKNIPNYLWIEWKMFLTCFTYVDYRVKRFLGIK
jgi:hypothetical protein